MGKRLLTIATFDQATQARLAKNALDEEGIQSSVSDENLVAMDWLLSNAIGGVKVQVWEEDAERAVAVLNRRFGEHGEGLGVAVSPEELAKQAAAAVPDEGEEPEHDETNQGEVDPPEVPPAPDSREEYARRFAFTSILCLFFPLLAPFGVYLFLNTAFGTGGLTSRGRVNFWIGTLFTLASLVWFPFFMAFVSSELGLVFSE